MIGGIIAFFVGTVLGMVLIMITIRRNRLLFTFMQAQKRKQGVAFLEDESKIMVQRVVDNFQNLSVTESGQIVIITPGSVKPVAGTMIQTVHGDLYKSVTTPFALRRFIWNRTREGWSADDIADFLEEIEKASSDEAIKEKYADLKYNSELKEELQKEIDDLKKRLQDKKLEKTEKQSLKIQLDEKTKQIQPFKNLSGADKHKYDIYLSLPSSIAAFVNTGLNRTSINLQDELKQITKQKMLGKKAAKWMGIIIAIGFGILLLFMGLKIGGPVLIEMINGGAQAMPAQPAIPAPTRIAL